MGIWRDSRRRLGWGRGGVINDNQEGGGEKEAARQSLHWKKRGAQ